ncbi:hypothetical protein TanjilG_27696 [Lupinus angustifolius]|uniref:Uncharacterized protein n=1 Tax=Lupinus angustifolius TaxID=3871 RepID=A0A4P1RHI2_LUPAN|nr:hypothetical protein TanjilG_27696 [Lupinus angustifolius]
MHKQCVEDAYTCLINRYSFSEDDIAILIDTDESYTQPMGKNISVAPPCGTREEDDTGYDECT